MLFLLGIVIVALRLGHGPSLFAAVLVPRPGDNLTPLYESAGLETMLLAELGVAHTAWRSRLQSGLSTPTFPESHGLYLPLIASRGSVGVMGLFPDDRRRFDDPDE